MKKSRLVLVWVLSALWLGSQMSSNAADTKGGNTAAPKGGNAAAQKGNADAAAKQLQQILATKPSQPDVEVDMVPAESMGQCQATAFKEGGYVGNMVLGPDGSTPVRVICRRDAAGSKEEKAEQLRFYKNGVEVFRDDFTTNECRWMGDLGTRRGIRSGSEIDHWTMITPEEATAEAVAALASGDEKRYRRVALSQEDLAALKMTGPVAEELTQQIESVSGFKALSEKLAIPAGVKWGAFNGNHPALLPQGRYELANDLPVYYNATVVLMNPDDPTQSHQLYIGDMVKVGDVWKIVGLPSGEPFGQTSDRITIASVLFPATEGGAAAAGGEDYSELGRQLAQSLEELETVSADQAAAVCDRIFNLYMNLGDKIKNEQSNFIRQASVFLLEQVQNGRYPEGTNKLSQLYDLLASQNAGRDLVAYVQYRHLTAEYYSASQKENVSAKEAFAAEEDYKEKLAAFADEYSRTAAAAEALMFLAQDKEFVQENDAAINYYTTVAEDFPDTVFGRRATGAVKRLSAMGQPYKLPDGWTYTDGSAVTIPSGKKTVIFGWASWMNPSDFDLMKRIASDNPDVTIIGVAFDGTPEIVQAALGQIGETPWKNIFIPKAEGDTETNESPAAIELGAQNAPLILLLDEEGKLLFPNIATVDDLKARLAPPVARQ